MIVIPSFRGLVSRVFATSASGSLWGWGYNGRAPGGFPNPNATGQLGINDVIHRSSPVQVGSGVNWSHVSSGRYHTIGIRGGKIYVWGANFKGQLGLSKYYSYKISSPVQVGTGSSWTSISAGESHNLALKSDGTLWSWGYNSNGQLGLGDYGNYAHRSSPVQVGSQTNWSSVSAGWKHSFAIKTDGSLWAWGDNSFGKLGDFSTIQRNSPVKIKDGTSWLMVSGGINHSLAIKSDSTLWSWGSNDNFQLGLGSSDTNLQHSSPMQIVGNSDWSKISAGGYHSLGIRNSGASGTLWAWGENYYGQLGRNDNIDESKPVQIGGNGWLSVSAGKKHSGAINSSEKLFFWGNNKNDFNSTGVGQIGDLTAIIRSSPVAIASSFNWLYIASMKYNSSFVIKKQ